MNHRLQPVALALVVLAVLGSCATSTLAPSGTAPVLSWPGSPATTIAVSWTAAGGEATVDLEAPTGSVTTHEASTTGRFLTVEITGLEPDTRYRYRIADDPVWRAFRTMPARPERFEFAILGDLQPFNDETDRTTSLVMEKVASLDPLFALQMGDVTEIGISQGSWERAIGVLSVLGAQTPLAVVAGNHDYYYGIPSARTFKRVFPAPYADPDSARKNTWYSTTVGPLHIAVLDTEADGDDFESQRAWLEADLAAARQAGTPWVFIAMHRPVLATTTSTDDPRWARTILPLAARYDVNAVFWGHDHAFEHYRYTYGANGLVLNPGDQPADDPIHLFTVGTAGARVDALYPGFFTHRPRPETRTWYDLATGEPRELTFLQHPWNEERVKRVGAGVRYQDPTVYPKAASYYSYPFLSGADARSGVYATDPSIRYSEDAEFFGYTYGETSIHYLWVEIRPDGCTITAHYADGEPGEHGTVITTPDGAPMRFELP